MQLGGKKGLCPGVATAPLRPSVARRRAPTPAGPARLAGTGGHALRLLTRPNVHALGRSLSRGGSSGDLPADLRSFLQGGSGEAPAQGRGWRGGGQRVSN